MRIRTVKPDFFKSEDVAALEPLARLAFIGLWLLADCAGRLLDRPNRIRAELFPYDNVDMGSILEALKKQGVIHRYTAEGQAVIQVVNFRKHQRISGREAQAESEISPPPDVQEAPGKHRGSNTEAPGNDRKGKERKGKEAGSDAASAQSSAKRFQKPEPEEVNRYATEIGAKVDGQAFCDFYESKGWKVGNAAMKDWKASVRTWNRRNGEKQTEGAKNEFVEV